MTTFNYLGSYTTNKINILLILTSSTHYNDSGTMFFIISEYFFFRDTFAQDTRIFDIRKLSGCYFLLNLLRQSIQIIMYFMQYILHSLFITNLIVKYISIWQ